MRIDDMILISVDDHVVEPPHLFEGRLPEKYRDIAPRVIRKDDGTDVWSFGGVEIPNVGLNAVAGKPPEEFGIEPTSFEDMREGCFDIDRRIDDMDANGVLAQMNFPSFPGFAGRLFASHDDKDGALALVRAYNDWHVDEWCGRHPGRMIPLALPVLWDAELAAAEVRRLVDKGCHAVTFSENPARLGYPSLHDPSWDPFWAACQDTDTVVCLHIGSSGQLVVTSPDAPIDVMITLQPMNIVQAAADLVWSRVLREFPRLQFALTEGGIGWIPYFLERADQTYGVHHHWTGADFGGRLPSEIFREQIVLCFIKDRHGLASAREIGVDRICYEVDYPHSDSTWPRSPEILAGELEGSGLTDEEVDAITYKNAMRFFSFDPFVHVAREEASVGALRARAAHVDVSPRSMAGPGDGKGRVTMAEMQSGR